MKDINCPYCDHPQEINHDDGYGYSEERIHQQQCGKCDKYFTFTTSIMYHYEVDKADCLNGGEHEYYPTHTFPKEYTKMRCSMCEDERYLTEDEKIKFSPLNIT